MKFVINGKAVDVPSTGIPSGGIIIWSGATDTIPTGWQLCDGTNGAPDLRDRFVLGAGTSYAVGATGGSEEVTLTVAQMPEHQHSATNYVNTWATSRINTTGSSNIFTQTTQSSSNINLLSGFSGSSQPHPNMPPYYALCYIMKL